MHLRYTPLACVALYLSFVGSLSAANITYLPSGPREVYVGWPVIASASDYQLERSADNGATWTDITHETLWRTPRDAVANPEGTIDNWQSARHLKASPSTTALYRLSYALAGQNERIVEAPQSITTPPLDAVPCYHSRPGAQQVIYLDFHGYVDDFAGSVAGARAGLEDTSLTYVKTAPFAFQGRFKDLSTTYPTENAIYDIWRMVAEDFAMFDVDITTETPPYEALVKSSEADMAYGKRVVIGYKEGTSTPWYPGGGGFSGGGTFGFQHDRPAYVFSHSSRQNIAAQVTHEVSHTLGLAHDGGRPWFAWFGETAYYRGEELTPNGEVNLGSYLQTGITWFPVMGAAPSPTPNNGYYYDCDDFINQWSRGNYSSSTTQEDDFAILLGLAEGNNLSFTERPPLYSAATRNLFLAPDEAGDTLATATHLKTFIKSAQHATDAVIGKHLSSDKTTTHNDVDCFRIITVSSGTLQIDVEPNYLKESEGSSLDAMIEVLNANGEVIASATTPQWNANVYYFDDIRNAETSVNLPAAGTYFLRVSGTVHPVTSTTLSPDGSASPETPWRFNDAENYGSVGPYTLTAAFTADATPTLPSPFTGDTTAFTEEAQTQILTATGGIIPPKITLDDGKGSTLSAAELSDVLTTLEGCLLFSKESATLTIAYRFDVIALDLSTPGEIAVTVQVNGADGMTSVCFCEGITFSIVDPLKNTVTALPVQAIEPLGDAKNTIKLTLSTENTPKIFAIRLVSRP